MTSDHDPQQPKTMRAATDPARHPVPSRRVLGALVACVFAVGLIAGAALGPAPTSSLANDSTIVQRVVALLAARAGEGAQATPPAAAGPSAGERKTAGAVRGRRANRRTKPTPEAAPATASAPPSSSSSGASPSGESTSGSEPSSGQGSEGQHTTGKPVRLPPIQHVWSIALAGSTFADAAATPASYPYLIGQLLARGTLLTSYSALDAYELAGDATLLPGGVGASLDTISEPACAAPSSQSSPCPEGSQPSRAEADAFLQRVVEPILASPAYGENGLIVVSFAPVSSTAGASTAALAIQPTAGALLLSPLLHRGVRSASPFNSLSPRVSVATIFKH